MKHLKAVLSVKFNSTYSSDELTTLFQQDLETFREVPGLIQKHYVAENLTGTRGGIYIFENESARTAFWNSELAKSIPAKYGVKLDTLRVEQFDIIIELNEAVLA